MTRCDVFFQFTQLMLNSEHKAFSKHPQIREDVYNKEKPKEGQSTCWTVVSVRLIQRKEKSRRIQQRLLQVKRYFILMLPFWIIHQPKKVLIGSAIDSTKNHFVRQMAASTHKALSVTLLSLFM